jgi:hypothetical protein
VPDVFGFVSEFLYLMKRCFVWVKWHDGDHAEELGKPGRVGVITQAQTCVHENGTLICFNQQTKRACFHFAGPAGIASKAVEQVYGHGDI